MAVEITAFFIGGNMTIPVTERLSQLYVGNGVNTRFDFVFRVFDQEDQTGIAVRLKVGSDFEFMDSSLYKVTVNQDGIGGFVTLLTPPDSSTYFYISGNTPVDQLLDITNYDNFYPDAIERALDKITAILQEWYNQIGFETQARILADIDYDQLAQARENELKAYIDGLIASINGDSILGVQFITNVETVNDIQYLLKWNGRKVHVNSYNPAILALATPFVGGGLFTYVDSLANVNNGVTVFNGWVRDTSALKLTTHDAGLVGDGSDTDATTRLQSIADAVSDGFEVEFIGNYSIKTNIFFNSKKNLKLSSVNGSISGDKANWTFGAAIDGTNRRGMFVFKNCPNLNLSRLVVTGIQKNIFGSFQDGDSAIQMLNCYAPKIKLCTLTNTFAWAIIGENCERAVVEYNVISDVVHQSGVNVIVGGGKNAKINFNHISNCGLYGIEWETYTAIANDTFEAIGNIIDDCYAGITPTGSGVTRGTIIANTITKSGYTAIWANAISACKNLSIYNNTLEENYRGAVLSSSPNTRFIGNPIFSKPKSDLYLKINPDYFVLKVLDANNFLIHLNAITATGTVYINSVEYTVTAIATYADSTSEFGLSSLRKVTVSQTISDALVLNKHIQRKVLSTDLMEANVTMLGASDNLMIKDNVLSGGLYCVYYDQSAAPSGSPKQYVYDNIFLDFGINAVIHTKSTSHVFYKGNKSNSLSIDTYNIHNDLITNGSFATKSLKMITAAAQTSSTKPVNRFGHNKSELILGFTSAFYNGVTTGSTAIKLNSGTTVVTPDGAGAPVGGNFYRYNGSLTKGINTIEFADTVGDLSFTNAYVDILVPA